jgi:type IV pilus assembly protein PilF
MAGIKTPVWINLNFSGTGMKMYAKWPLVLGALLLVLLAGCASSERQQEETSTGLQTVDSSGQNESDTRRRARLRVELAMEYFRSRQYSIALEELRNAQNIDANYNEIHNAFALVYMELNETKLAEDSFQRALRLGPNDSETNNNYGWFLCQNGQPQRAINHFQVALRNPLYATPAIAARNAGICSMRAGDMNTALEFLQRSFRFDPGSGLTMYYLAETLYRSKEFTRARFYIARLNEQVEPTPAGLWLAIKIERKLGDRFAEERLANQLRRRFPESRENMAYQRGNFDD